MPLRAVGPLNRVTTPKPSRNPHVDRDPTIAAATVTPSKGHILQAPFRSLTTNSRRSRKGSAARLWNPTNSTPRADPSRQQKRHQRRRPSTPPPPSVPINHPELDSSADVGDPVGTGAIYPLLTLSQVRQLRHPDSQRNSLQADRRASNDHRISLPSSVRASYGEKRFRGPTPTVFDTDANPQRNLDPEGRGRGAESPVKFDKSKGIFTMAVENKEADQSYSRDLERGPDVTDPRQSSASMGEGIGSAISSSNSSIMGEDVQADDEVWGPQHPCYPHLNPHVPVESPEHSSTRIIRIKRDWMIQGDLAPTFSNLYPEILDPAGLSEQAFRRIIEKLNGELIPIFNPFSLRNVVDGVLGVVTGWLWDDFGLTSAKSRLNKLEKWIDNWNLEMEKTMSAEDGTMAPKLISLRRTGYMSLDIQIPDPEIAAAPSTTGAGGSGTALPLEPAPVAASA